MKELIIRLIKDNKIVGYEYHINGKIYHTPDINELVEHIHIYQELLISTMNYIKNIDDEVINKAYIPHDSLELGIRIGDKIIFDGDILQFHNKCNFIYKVYISLSSSSLIDPETLLETEMNEFLNNISGYEYNLEVIGNIHEEEHEYENMD